MHGSNPDCPIDGQFQSAVGWTLVGLFRRTGVLIAAHILALAAFLTDPTALEWALVLPIIMGRGLVVTIGYHRYFSHRSFKTSRAGQFILGVLCCLNLQNGPLWWAAVHRHHHRHSDRPDDAHSPVQGGFLWGHVGWLFGRLTPPDWNSIRDLRRFPELVWLDRLWLLPSVLVATGCWFLGGWSCVCLDFFLTAVFTMHMTFAVNSLAHLVGWRNFDTRDRSRNSHVLGWLTLGDGYHNNHHHYPAAAQAGFFPGERDTSFNVIRVLEALGLVWGVRRVPASKLEQLDPARNSRRTASIGNEQPQLVP